MTQLSCLFNHHVNELLLADSQLTKWLLFITITSNMVCYYLLGTVKSTPYILLQMISRAEWTYHIPANSKKCHDTHRVQKVVVCFSEAPPVCVQKQVKLRLHSCMLGNPSGFKMACILLVYLPMMLKGYRKVYQIRKLHRA